MIAPPMPSAAVAARDVPVEPSRMLDSATVTLATSRLAALHAYLRRASVGSADDTVPSALRAAVRAYRVIDAALPQTIQLPSGETQMERDAHDRRVRERYWRVLESVVFASASIDDLRLRAARMTTPIGGTVRADSILARVADALVSGWDAYGHEMWPAASADLAARTRWWAESVAPRSAVTIAALRRALGVGDAAPVPRVLIVPGGADRGGATYRTPAGPLIVVDVGRYRGADLIEVVFHEIAHALDAGAPGAGTLGTLRTTLRAAAIPADAVEQTAHAAIFALAASVTRDQFDAVRVDAGERYGSGTGRMGAGRGGITMPSTRRCRSCGRGRWMRRASRGR
jgi:hypothetical protein